jgi:hypothetical protein
MNARTMALAGHHFGGQSSCFPNNISQYKYSKRMVPNHCHHSQQKSSGESRVSPSILFTFATIYFFIATSLKSSLC